MGDDTTRWTKVTLIGVRVGADHVKDVFYVDVPLDPTEVVHPLDDGANKADILHGLRTLDSFRTCGCRSASVDTSPVVCAFHRKLGLTGTAGG